MQFEFQRYKLNSLHVQRHLDSFAMKTLTFNVLDFENRLTVSKFERSTKCMLSRLAHLNVNTVLDLLSRAELTVPKCPRCPYKNLCVAC